MSAYPPLLHNPRYKAIDLFRGVACLMVVIHHTGYAILLSEVGGPGLEPWLRRAVATFLHTAVGTPMFFVISGYCVLASLDAIRRRGTSPWTFELKRLRRTYPPYWASLLLFVGIVTLLDRLKLAHLYHGIYALELYPPTNLDLSQWLGNLTLTESWRTRVGGSYELVYTRVAWTLCFQEQFYFLSFLVLMCFRKHLYMALAILTALTLALRLVAWDSGSIHRLGGTFPVLWHEFAVGLAVYWRINVAQDSGSRRAIELLLIGLLGIALWEGIDSTAKAAGFGLLLIGLHPWDARIASWRKLDPIRNCGRRCFSIYLTHLPICVVGSLALTSLGLTAFWARALVVVPVVSCLALAVGYLFYQWVELPFTGPPKTPPSPPVPTAPADPESPGEASIPINPQPGWLGGSGWLGG